MLEEMVGREMLVAGDTLLLKTDTGLLQHFEAEQIRDVKGKTDGIKKDQYGKPLSFSVCPWEEFGSLSTKPTTVYAKNAFFITKPERPSSVRGVPPCQSSFPMLHRVNDVCDSEAIAYQLISRIAISINREDGGVLALQESKPESTDFRKRIYELGYALVFNAEPGEKIQGVERNIPGKNFTESIVMFLRLLGLPLGMPLELVLLDWTKSNYSQSRAVLLQAYKTFVLWQQLIEDFFHDPVLDWKIREWCKAGLLPRKLAQTAIKRQWLVPTYPWLDLVKEAEAYGLKVERCFSTHAEVCKSLDSDLEDVLRARRSEVERAIKIKQEIKKETGENVPYEIFCGLKVQPTAAGKQTKGGKDEGNEEEEEVNDG
jgi:capsid protein